MSQTLSVDPNNRYAALDEDTREMHRLVVAHYREALLQALKERNTIKVDGPKKGQRRPGKAVSAVNPIIIALDAQIAELRQEFAEVSGMNFADLTNAQVVKALTKVAAARQIRNLEHDQEKALPDAGSGKIAALRRGADNGEDVFDLLRKSGRKGKGGVPADRVPSKVLAKTKS